MKLAFIVTSQLTACNDNDQASNTRNSLDVSSPKTERIQVDNNNGLNAQPGRYYDIGNIDRAKLQRRGAPHEPVSTGSATARPSSTGSDPKQLAQFSIGRPTNRQDFVHRRVELDLAVPLPTRTQLAGTVQIDDVRPVDTEEGRRRKGWRT